MELSQRQQAFLDLARALLRLDRRVQAVVGRALDRELGLGLRAMFVLTAIERGAGHPGAVSERLDLPPPSVTRTLEALVADGLATRERSRADRRHVELALTPRGEEVVVRARAVLAQALAESWPEVDAERARELAGALEALLAGPREGA